MKSLRRLFALFALLLSVLVLGQGCVFAPVGDLGDLEARWFFDGAAVCPNDVVNVDIVIDGRDSVTTPCTEGGRRISGFAPGTYTVRAVGVDIDGTPTWSSEAGAVTILEANVATADFNLLPN